ncbi:MAG: LacI family transcriptional regulator [Syntrophomonadaceae bacterium]|jgi:LacI family transcriptional regulator|nr:LacI family transcriptional regulator [Syntrophomonadaceae bacterium]
MATIYDIAKRVGVSPATVSRALNNKGYVKDEVKTQILRAAEELHYIPNAAARSLIYKKTWTIALLLPDISNPFFATIARGVDDAISHKGYSLIICNSDGSLHNERKHIQILRERRVDGIVMIPSGNQLDYSNTLDLDNMPFVIVDRDPGIDSVDVVLFDDFNGAKQATEHLVGLSHQAIAIITGPRNVSTGVERLRGFKHVMLAAGLQVNPGYVFEGDFRESTGYEIGKKIVDGTSIPTAIFATNDLMALGALTAFKESGIRIPEDIAIVGYDGIPETNRGSPSLTTVIQPNYELGQAAGDRLIRRIENVKESRQKIVLNPRLVIRDSTARRQTLTI